MATLFWIMVRTWLFIWPERLAERTVPHAALHGCQNTSIGHFLHAAHALKINSFVSNSQTAAATPQSFVVAIVVDFV